MQRKGIAPVVATIILVLIVIVAAGGAFTWINQIINDQIEEADRARNREVVVRDIQCPVGDFGVVNWLLVNSGTIDLDDEVNVYVYNVSSGNLWDTNTSISITSGGLGPSGSFSAGTQANTVTANSPGVNFTDWTFASGNPMRVEFEFTADDGFTVSAQCDPS